MNNSTTATVLSRDELLAFMLPVLPLAVIDLVGNDIIVYLYVRYKALRAESGIHMMALLALFDLLSSATTLQVDFLVCASSLRQFQSSCQLIAYTNCTSRPSPACSSVLLSAVCEEIA